MDMKQFDVFGQIGFDGGTVIHVHEFRWDQPDGEAAGCQPGIAQQQEMGVKPGQAADVEAEAVSDQRFQPLLVVAVEVMMPHIGRVGQDQVIEPVGREPREIARHDPQAGGSPEAFGGVGEWRIDLHPASIGDRPAAGMSGEGPSKTSRCRWPGRGMMRRSVRPCHRSRA